MPEPADIGGCKKQGRVTVAFLREESCVEVEEVITPTVRWDVEG